MSRRRNSGEQEFGSDSFLDIIANIVGILIILIVIAGVKVARQAAVISADKASAVQIADADAAKHPSIDQADTVAANPASESGPVQDAETDDSETDSKPETVVVQTVPAAVRKSEIASDQIAELDGRIADLTAKLDQTRDTAATTETELHQLLALVQDRKDARDLQIEQIETLQQEQTSRIQSVDSLLVSIADIDKKATNFQTTISSLTRRQKYVANALKQVAIETQQLREVLDESEASQPAGERLNHRLSPVGRSVTDAELHFRLHNGRIAHVPIDALVERLKDQVSARRNIVMRFHRHEGVVGPVGGFLMKYKVQRESSIQALQNGGSGYRIAISGWTILPGDTLAAEPVDLALRIGSRFRQILEAADTDTTITIWLYAEDFEHFRSLRELAHGLNLRVAARPLPKDTPIAGSPNGSRSTSQ